MAQIFVSTDDIRLYRLISLLCAECGHEVGDTAPSIAVTDALPLPARFSSLPVLLIGDGGLARPFSHKLLKERMEALLSDAPLPLLTPTEKRLYDALLAASPAPVSREALIRAAFGEERDEGKLNLYIHYLRKKIETDGKKRIFACRGKGYYLSC